MALNINLQGIVDAMVADISKTDVQAKAELVVESQFDDIIDAKIDLYTNKIKSLKAEPDGATVNASSITYYESRIKRYQSTKR